MPLIVFGIVLLVLIFGPGLWVKHVLRKYSTPTDRYPMSGAEFARRLLDAAELTHVKTEVTDSGDHYDPMAKAVRLMPDRYNDHSLTAITVAAHEVGHALQDHLGYQPLSLRTRLVVWVRPLEKIGAGILIGAPLLAAALRIPSAGMLMFSGGILTLGTAALVHMVTLPTEIDASFRRALPMLEASQILYPSDMPHARRLLSAAAMTYVSASLMSLLNIARWIAILRR
ncbi:MAG: zinc metallopeptidase [Pseudomonadota bacterium]